MDKEKKQLAKKPVKKILYIDSTYLGERPNREKGVIIMSAWIKDYSVKITILTTKEARKFYSEIFEKNIFDQIEFKILPFSRDFLPNNPLSIVFEYLKRSLAMIFFSKKKLGKNFDVAYSLTAIFPDVTIGRILKIKYKKLKLCVVFDNFVKHPRERKGNYFFNLIPFLSYKFSMALIKKFDVIFSAMIENNLEKLRKIMTGLRAIIVKDINGIDLDFSNKISFPEKPIYDILFIGRLHADKGIFDLLEIVRMLKKSFPVIKVVIIGKGSPKTEEQFEKIIKSYGISSNIEMLGYVSKEDKYKILKSTKAFCFFSYYESYPVSVIEAMSCGLKIFAYDLEAFFSEPFIFGDIQTFSQKEKDYEKIAGMIAEYLRNELYKNKKNINLELIDQKRSAKTQFDNF